MSKGRWSGYAGVVGALCLSGAASTLRAQAQQGTGAATQGAAAVSTMTTPASSALLRVPAAELKAQQVESMQHQLADWPQLGRYREDNAKLGAPAPGQKRVVFFGDSITDIWGRQRGKFFPDMPWVNRGIGGQTTPQMLVRFQQDVLALQPEAVVILAGVNDIAGNTGPESLDTIKNNFRSMVILAKAAHVRVLLCSPLPAAAFPWNPGVDPRDEVAALNTWIQQYAGEQHVGYLDYFSALVGPDRGMKPGLSSDGIHPTDAGYAVMEPMARAAVMKTLAGPRP